MSYQWCPKRQQRIHSSVCEIEKCGKRRRRSCEEDRRGKGVDGDLGREGSGPSLSTSQDTLRSGTDGKRVKSRGHISLSKRDPHRILPKTEGLIDDLVARIFRVHQQAVRVKASTPKDPNAGGGNIPDNDVKSNHHAGVRK